MWGRSARELAFSILWLIYFGGGTLILVTVDTFDTPTRYESSKTMTVTKMATATRLIPVTVDTFDTPQRYGCRRFVLLTLNAGPCFTSQLESQTWLNAVIYQSSQRCCLLYLYPRGANLADVAILKSSKYSVLKLSTFPAGVLLLFCNLFQSSTCCYLKCW